MNNNNIKIKMLANSNNITFARGAISSFLVDAPITINILNEIKTVVSEAVTNAIVHGYQGDEDNIVQLEFDYNKGILTIVVEDKGIGIEDIKKAKEPLFTTKILEERAGLGFTIMEIFSDTLDITSTVGEGTKVVCTKKIEDIIKDDALA